MAPMVPLLAGLRPPTSAVPALLVTLLLVACQSTTSATPTPWWTVLSPPAVPPLELAAEHGGPPVPRRVCIEKAIDPIVHDPTPDLAAVLAALGMEVVSSDCDAVLSVEARGHRIAASYLPGGTCFSGWDVSGVLEWSVGGVGAGRWPVADRHDPPYSAELPFGCFKKDDPISLTWLDSWQPGQVLVDLFGGAGFAAPFLVFPLYSRVPYYGEESPSREQAFPSEVRPPDPAALSASACAAAVSRIALALWQSAASDERDCLAYRLQWLAGVPCGESAGKALELVIPYLIVALAAEEQSAQHLNHLRAALRDVTGQSFDSAKQWWDWWQQRQGAS